MLARTDTVSEKTDKLNISIEEQYVTIKTNRIIMRSLNQYTIVNLTNYYRLLLGNPENVQMFGDGKQWSEESIKNFIIDETKKWEMRDRFSSFAVCDVQTDSMLGNLQVYYPSPGFEKVGHGHKNVAEIIYIVDHNYWGRGYGSEIAKAGKKYIKYITSQLESEKNVTQQNHLPDEIIATVHPDNVASVRILEKTLKNKEDSILTKFGAQPRVLFFKSIKKEKLNIQPDKEELRVCSFSFGRLTS